MAKTDVIVKTGAVAGFEPPAPTRRKPGNASKYPFDTLGAGEFFTVEGRTKRQMHSAIRNANLKYRNEIKDATGNVVNSVQEREFHALDIDWSDEQFARLKGTQHDKASVMVVRSK